MNPLSDVRSDARSNVLADARAGGRADDAAGAVAPAHGQPSDALWASVLEAIRATLGAEPTAAPLASEIDLIGDLQLLERSERTLRVAVSAASRVHWLSGDRLARLTSSVARVTDGTQRVALLPRSAAASAGRLRGDPTRSLSRFIASPGTQSARSRAESLVREAGQYPCLASFHGPGGSGKTHLLHGIGQGVAERFGAERVLLTDGESLSHALVSSLRAGELDRFREYLRSLGALLIDDVEALAGRDATQDELVQALDPLFGARALIAVTSAKPLAQISGLAHPLRRALAGGASVELRRPPWEARVAIVLDRFSAWGLDCASEVAALIANVLGDDLGEIDCQLTRLLAHPGLESRLLDIDGVRLALADEDHASAPLAPEVVIDLVTGHFNLRVADLRSPSRSPRLTTPRQIGMYLLRRHCGLSYPEIGQCFKRHHTTAMHACRRIESRRERQSSLRATIGLLEKELLRISDRAADPS